MIEATMSRPSKWLLLTALVLSGCADPDEPSSPTSSEDEGPCGVLEPDTTDGELHSALIGCWEGLAAVGSNESLLRISGPSSGAARLFFYLGETLYQADFTVHTGELNSAEAEVVPEDEAQTETTGGQENGGETTGSALEERSSHTTGEVDEGPPPSRVRLRFECDAKADGQGPCAELDFVAECQLSEQPTGYEMLCTGDGNWENYPLGWRHIGP